ncbi:MAG TPA: phosphatase PAP2 family protein [Thermoleophilia bacterium]|nr:phosphatase PAP2 family protein [Thermoleophilia bacterium]
MRASGAADVLHEAKRVDAAVYCAVERTRTPILDVPLRRLSQLADHSMLWLVIAAALFAFGGRSGRRAAVTGAAAIGLTSVLANQPLKALSRRARPIRGTVDVSTARHLRMPTSTSFPSGHSAAGFAFASAVASFKPGFGLPLRGLAAVVAYSRVHTGVHFPSDVIVGALLGIGVGESTALAVRSIESKRAHR